VGVRLSSSTVSQTVWRTVIANRPATVMPTVGPTVPAHHHGTMSVLIWECRRGALATVAGIEVRSLPCRDGKEPTTTATHDINRRIMLRRASRQAQKPVRDSMFEGSGRSQPVEACQLLIKRLTAYSLSVKMITTGRWSPRSLSITGCQMHHAVVWRGRREVKPYTGLSCAHRQTHSHHSVIARPRSQRICCWFPVLRCAAV
jgi:hypothetical protein